MDTITIITWDNPMNVKVIMEIEESSVQDGVQEFVAGVVDVVDAVDLVDTVDVEAIVDSVTEVSDEFGKKEVVVPVDKML